MDTNLHAPSLPLPLTFQPHKPSLSFLPLGGKNGRRRRRRRTTIGSAAITALRKALSLTASLPRLLPRTEPFDLLLLHHGGGNGSGGLGFLPGGSDGGWFGRNRGRARGLMEILVSVALASAIRAFWKTKETDLGFRVLVPAILGLKIGVWRRWIGVLVLGFAFYVFLTAGVGRRGEVGGRKFVGGWRR